MTLVPYRSALMPDVFNAQIDQLFEEVLRTIGGVSWKPACNAYEDQNGFWLELAVPGMEPKDIEVHVEDGILTVKGRYPEPSTENGKTWHIREACVGTFARSFTLPSYVDHDKASAAYKNGILTLSFPKREEAKPHRIMITG